MFGGRFLSIDFYIGRSPRQIRNVEEFNEYLARPERPVVVINGRTWRLIQGQITSPVRLVDTLEVRGQRMLIVENSAPPSTDHVPR